MFSWNNFFCPNATIKIKIKIKNYWRLEEMEAREWARVLSIESAQVARIERPGARRQERPTGDSSVAAASGDPPFGLAPDIGGRPYQRARVSPKSRTKTAETMVGTRSAECSHQARADARALRAGRALRGPEDARWLRADGSETRHSAGSELLLLAPRAPATCWRLSALRSGADPAAAAAYARPQRNRHDFGP